MQLLTKLSVPTSPPRILLHGPRTVGVESTPPALLRRKRAQRGGGACETAVDLSSAFAQQQQAASGQEQPRVDTISSADSTALSTAGLAAMMQLAGGDSASQNPSTKTASGETGDVLVIIEVEGTSCGDGGGDAAGDSDGLLLPKLLLRQSSLAGERLESVTQFGAVTDIDVEGNSVGYLTARYYCELNRFDAQRAIAAYFDANRTPPPAGCVGLLSFFVILTSFLLSLVFRRPPHCASSAAAFFCAS